MKFISKFYLILLSFAFVPTLALGQTAEIDALKEMAEKGEVEAQFHLGLKYEFGLGVTEDDAEAVKWYRKAAEQGDSNAQYNLGVMYDNGEVVPENYVEAYKWANLAAAQGHEAAQKSKNILAKKMTPQQIAEAQRLSAAFKPRKETPNKADTGSAKSTGATSSQPDSFGSGFFVTANGY